MSTTKTSDNEAPTVVRREGPQRIVIKLGSSSIVDEKTGHVRLSNLSRLGELVRTLRNMRHEVILVTSGAVGVGCIALGLTEKPDEREKRQALAAIGQGRLMGCYINIFQQMGMNVGQLLMTRASLNEKEHFENARQTMQEVLAMDAVPIVNEDDTNCVDDLRFGDNDTLSAIMAAMIDADWLFLLTDVDHLYTSNPATNPNAKPVFIVNDIDKTMKACSVEGTGSGSNWGTGGMATKIVAARLACSSGCHCVIANANKVEVIVDIVKGADDLGTIFTAHTKPFSTESRWMTHGRKSEGVVVVNAEGLANIQAGEPLTFKGMLPIVEEFKENDAITVIDESGREIARGLASASSQNLREMEEKFDEFEQASIQEEAGGAAPEEVFTHLFVYGDKGEHNLAPSPPPKTPRNQSGKNTVSRTYLPVLLGFVSGLGAAAVMMLVSSSRGTSTKAK